MTPTLCRVATRLAGFALLLVSMACTEPTTGGLDAAPAIPIGAGGLDTATSDAPDVAAGDAAALADSNSDAAADSAATAGVDGAAAEASDASAPSDAADAAVEVVADVKPEVVVPKGVPSATITAPTKGAVFELGKPVEFAGIATDTLAASPQLQALWTSDKDGVLGASTPDAQGVVKLTTNKLSAGQHLIQLEVKNPQGIAATDARTIGVCAWSAPESFDTKLDGAKWKIYGDAYWDPGGWLEMTGNAQGKFGKIWNIAEYVQPGDVQISFKIATGGGINGGADGFAMSVIDVKSVAELEAVLAKAGDGGCLGYGVSGACGKEKVSAFHVEIDTFKNAGDPNTDPTPENHIAVTLDGDPGKHWLWKETPGIEDLKWHTVTVEVKGAKVRVTLDTVELFNDAIPDFLFRGGYIGFTGSTGWASNYHRFDELKILQQCVVK